MRLGSRPNLKALVLEVTQVSDTPAYFSRVSYEGLDGRQKEVHNYHHIAALLARHGYASYPIRDDWNGGDMIARHMTDVTQATLMIQIKGRVTFDRKYLGKRLWIGLPVRKNAYVYPHDIILNRYLSLRAGRGQPLEASKAWSEGGCVHWPTPTEELRQILEPYLLIADADLDDRFTVEAGDMEIVSPEIADR